MASSGIIFYRFLNVEFVYLFLQSFGIWILIAKFTYHILMENYYR